MCLTAEALALFLNMLDPAIIESQAQKITVHAALQDTVWVQSADLWCTDARHPERLVEAD
ncbi:hypothetical protein ACFO5X_10395 [Seohaeicola nanhaiensis]|uniref:Uncharacterized protein n=1 Tax=Seohaeicola nanhaiensis TaxID=1387282 RepID=A0ABV9KGC0_9RHOB